MFALSLHIPFAYSRACSPRPAAMPSYEKISSRSSHFIRANAHEGNEHAYLDVLFRVPKCLFDKLYTGPCTRLRFLELLHVLCESGQKCREVCRRCSFGVSRNMPRGPGRRHGTDLCIGRMHQDKRSQRVCQNQSLSVEFWKGGLTNRHS